MIQYLKPKIFCLQNAARSAIYIYTIKNKNSSTEKNKNIKNETHCTYINI